MKKLTFTFCLLASAIFAVAASHAQQSSGSGGTAAGSGATAASGGTSSAAAGAGTSSSPRALQSEAAARQQGLPNSQPNRLNTTGDQFNPGGSTQFNDPTGNQFNDPTGNQFTQPGPGSRAAGQVPGQREAYGIGGQPDTFPSGNRYNEQRAIQARSDLSRLEAGTQDSAARIQAGRDMQAGQSRDPNMMRDGGRGELGVWLTASAGPGVEIRRVSEGSAAAQAGLQPGDVLLQVNGRAVASPMEVQRTIRAIPAGETTMLEVWRDGAQQEISATLQSTQEEYSVGYRGDSTQAGRMDMIARTERLEEQMSMLMREVQQLRAQMREMHNSGSVSTSADARPLQPATQPDMPQSTSPFDRGATELDAVEPAARITDEASAAEPRQTPRSATESVESANNEPAAEAEERAAEIEQPAAEEPADDLFGAPAEEGASAEEAETDAGSAETEAATETETTEDESLF